MATETRAVVAQSSNGAAVLEQVIIAGDLAKLSAVDRVRYYRSVCESIGLNPLTKPFDYIVLNGRLTLYATRTATDQLRSIKGISVDSALRDTADPDYATWLVSGHDGAGRVDTEIGSVSIAGLKGEARANAIMKALTKAKRRLTLSLAGLGWLDEVEVDSIPSAELATVDQETGEIQRKPSLRESIAERTAAVKQPEPAVTGQPGASEETGPNDETVAVGSPPSAAAVSQCLATSPFDGEEIEQCRKAKGHPGAHRSTSATW